MFCGYSVKCLVESGIYFSDTWGVVIPFKQVTVYYEHPSHLDDLSDFQKGEVFHKVNAIPSFDTPV